MGIMLLNANNPGHLILFSQNDFMVVDYSILAFFVYRYPIILGFSICLSVAFMSVCVSISKRAALLSPIFSSLLL